MESNCLRPELLTLYFMSNKILFTVVTAGLLKTEDFLILCPFWYIHVDGHAILVHCSNEQPKNSLKKISKWAEKHLNAQMLFSVQNLSFQAEMCNSFTDFLFFYLGLTYKFLRLWMDLCMSITLRKE